MQGPLTRPGRGWAGVGAALRAGILPWVRSQPGMNHTFPLGSDCSSYSRGAGSGSAVPGTAPRPRQTDRAGPQRRQRCPGSPLLNPVYAGVGTAWGWQGQAGGSGATLGPCPWGRPACVTGRKNPPGSLTQPQGTRESVKSPTSCSLLPTTPLSRVSAAHPDSPISNAPSLQISPAPSLASGSAGNTPPVLFTGAKSTLLAAGGVSLRGPAPAVPRLYRGHRSRLLPGYIHKTSLYRGLGRGIRLRRGGTAEPPHSPPRLWQLIT